MLHAAATYFSLVFEVNLCHFFNFCKYKIFTFHILSPPIFHILFQLDHLEVNFSTLFQNMFQCHTPFCKFPILICQQCNTLSYLNIHWIYFSRQYSGAKVSSIYKFNCLISVYLDFKVKSIITVQFLAWYFDIFEIIQLINWCLSFSLKRSAHCSISQNPELIIW